MKQFFKLLSAHFKEIIREPSVLFWGIVFPILMAWGLGLAFTAKPKITANIVYIQPSGKDTVHPFFLPSIVPVEKVVNHHSAFFRFSYQDQPTGKVQFNFYPRTWSQANTMLKRGETAMVIDLKNGQALFYYDRMNQEAQLLFLQLKGLLDKGPDYFLQQSAHAHPLIIAGTRYIDFLIPGLLGMGIMMSCMWGISYGLIEKRSRKLLRRMVATPMHKPVFLFSLFTARFVMNILEAVLLFIFAFFYFGITIQGNIFALLLLLIAGNIAFSGISALISSRTANTEVGNGLINAIVTPMMVISGVFFSYHSFPEWLIQIIKLLPLTMLNDGVRAVFNEGAGLAETIFPISVLILEGVITTLISLKIFKWY